MNVLEHIDRALFTFLNTTLANPVSDRVFLFFTSLTTTWYGALLLGTLWLALVVKGGRRGRIVALALLLVVTASDQFSSRVVKNYVERPRPCHEVDGARVVAEIHLVVPCGSGYSFPSSHAVNAFAIATFVAHYFRRWRMPLFVFASLVALSRVVVGVHFPSDIAGGAVIGAAVAYCFVALLALLKVPLDPPPGGRAAAEGSA